MPSGAWCVQGSRCGGGEREGFINGAATVYATRTRVRWGLTRLWWWCGRGGALTHGVGALYVLLGSNDDCSGVRRGGRRGVADVDNEAIIDVEIDVDGGSVTPSQVSRRRGATRALELFVRN